MRECGPEMLSVSLPCRILAALLVLTVVNGCALLGRLGFGDGADKPNPKIGVSWVSVAVLPGVNQNWPVSVDLVQVRQEALVELLLQMDPVEWFGGGGEGFRLAHPDAVLNQWEVVPGTAIEPERVRRRGRFGGVLFCGLREPTPPIRVAHKGRLRVTVDESGCALNGVNRKTQSADGPEQGEEPGSVKNKPRYRWWKFW